MDKYHGDLTDILRASGGALGQSSDIPPVSNWEFLDNPTSTFPSVMEDNRDVGGGAFGDPFCNMRDPLLHELNGAGSSCLGSPNPTHHILPTSIDNAARFCGAAGAANTINSSNLLAHRHQQVFEEDIHSSPSSIFKRIQISPADPTKLPMSSCQSPVMTPATSSPRGFKASASVTSDMINVNSSKSCLIENTGPVQIPSPRNLGIKRRKSQAKKVVCIPAPAAPNSRSSSGEIVPSDLWAWRKYGQKPIKGSPYPRGYYRCSSSKGCSARKQVERSRTDPNMLVITYTSEHNHPWPTQRNALAGSTRSQPLKNINNAASKSTTGSRVQTSDTNKEQKERSNGALSPSTMNVGATSTTANTSVKEESDDIARQLEMADNDFSEGFSQSYRPEMPETSQSDDVFAELGEIEAEPFELLFTSRLAGHDEQKDVRALDSLSAFDWTSFEEGKRKGL